MRDRTLATVTDRLAEPFLILSCLIMLALSLMIVVDVEQYLRVTVSKEGKERKTENIQGR